MGISAIRRLPRKKTSRYNGAEKFKFHIIFQKGKEAIATTADTFQQFRESKALLLSVVASVSATEVEMF